MDLKLNVINYSNNISTNELIDCLNLLPEKYKDLNTQIFIFDTWSRYIFHSLKNLNFIYFVGGIIDHFINYFSSSDELGHYNIGSRSIYIFENRILKMLDKRISILPHLNNYNEFKDYLTITQINTYKSSWSKYVLLDCIIHELTHAIQHKENRFPNRIKYLTSKWNTIDIELEAVSMSIDTFKINHESFSQILKVSGITIAHTLNPLKIKYKYNIKLN